MDRYWDENPKELVFYSQWGKLFAINLLFTTKQYKVDNIDNFVYYGKTRLKVLVINEPNKYLEENFQQHPAVLLPIAEEIKRILFDL